MSAEKQKRPDNSRPDPITVFLEKYATALHEAIVSKETTDTAGWQNLFSGHRQQQIDLRRAEAKKLKQIAIAMEDRGLTPEEEKELATVKKMSEAINDAHANFTLQTIGPVREPVVICDGLRREAVNEARRIERETPLVNSGLEFLMTDAVAGVDKPTWNDETGRIGIEPGKVA